MRDYPQFEDLGLDPDADKTPDLRPGKDDSPGARNTEAVRTNPSPR